nr:hypothetical protein CFP56_21613 [Quercus suber]
MAVTSSWKKAWERQEVGWVWTGTGRLSRECAHIRCFPRWERSVAAANAEEAERYRLLWMLHGSISFNVQLLKVRGPTACGPICLPASRRNGITTHDEPTKGASMIQAPSTNVSRDDSDCKPEPDPKLKAHAEGHLAKRAD